MNKKEIKFAQIETQKTILKLTSCPNFPEIQKTVDHIVNSNEHISYCEEHNGRMYHLLQNKEHPKGIYRTCQASLYRSGSPDWEMIFKVSDFDKLLKDDVYLESYMHLVEKPELMLLHLSSQGQDAHYTLEFNIKNKTIVTNGFHLPLSKSFIQWRDSNSVWLGPAWEKSQLTSSLYPKDVWLLKRQQTLDEATLIFQGSKDDIFVEAWRYLDSHGSPLDMIKQYHSFYHFSYYVIQPNLSVIPLKLPSQCDVCGYLNGHLLVHLKEDWLKKDKTYPVGSVLAVKLQKGQLKNIISLFEPQSNQVVETIETSKDFIFIHYLDHIYSQAKVLLFKNNQIQQVDFPNLHTVNFELIDQPWHTNCFYLAANDLIHEPILYLWDAFENELSILRKQKPLFNTEGITLKQFFATSSDGTQIPYFWCGTHDDTPSPTLIYSYGGFGVNELPHYMPIVGKIWLEKKFSFVIANLRGGAELGENWHFQATKENKYRTVEDLISIIKDLQKKNLTTPEKTCIQGASNGALITANTMLQIPEKLQAVICEVPIIDMLHYTHYGSGPLWVEEYGDPKNKNILLVLEKLTVLNQIREKQPYPQLLITTNLTDDRVDPIHAILLHQEMLKKKHTSYLFCPHIGGHESLNSQTQQIDELAYLWIFLYNALKII